VDIATEIRAAKDLSEALDCVVRHFAADTGTLHILEDDGMLHLKASSGQFDPPVARNHSKNSSLRRNGGSRGSAANLLMPDRPRSGMEGAVVVPIFDGARLIGALGVANRSVRIFSDEDKGCFDRGRAGLGWTIARNCFGDCKPRSSHAGKQRSLRSNGLRS
jgi:L-methionine (R)-S-oxide reductase